MKISFKFAIGEIVQSRHPEPLKGIVTRCSLDGKDSQTFNVSIVHEGLPKNCVFDEVELESCGKHENKLGFGD